MVLSTQCIMQPKPKKMLINVAGDLQFELHQRRCLYIIKIVTSGATGYFVEYAGKVFENMSMEGRMTVC
jgi:3-isopropylmalate/(R)-2-methylmalate dehydratase large subunit